MNQWRPLYFLNIYRLLITGLFVSFFYFKAELHPFASLDPKLFYMVSLAYFVFSLFSNFTIDTKWPAFFLQSHSHLFVDIFAILLLMHASGGVSSGVGLLMIIPVAAGSIFLFRLMSYFYAALASILILLDQFYLFLNFNIALSYPQAGMLGMVLFATALASNYLLDKIKSSEDLASQRGEDLAGMEYLASFVMQRLNTPVLVINQEEKIQLRNNAATEICLHLKRTKKTYLHEFSENLSQSYKMWLSINNSNNNDENNNHENREIKSFILEQSNIEILPHFAKIKQSKDSETLIFLEDISILKQQAQQEKLASLGRLTASIAHEIRNPLSAITHASELLAESNFIQKQDTRLTQIIDKQSQRLNKIIDTVLNLSRKQSINTKEINLDNWLTNYLNEQIHFSTKKIKLQITNSPHNDELNINFDPLHLQQILNNLIQNALQHATSNTIQIRVYKKIAVTIDVINEGKVIIEEDIKNLFEPFFTTRSSGTGLGLYMAKELATLNKAQLNYTPNNTGQNTAYPENTNNKHKTCFKITFNSN